MCSQVGDEPAYGRLGLEGERRTVKGGGKPAAAIWVFSVYLDAEGSG